MEVKKSIGIKIIEYYYAKNGVICHHKIDGPSFIVYKTEKKEEVGHCYYYIYDEQFYPWWLSW